MLDYWLVLMKKYILEEINSPIRISLRSSTKSYFNLRENLLPVEIEEYYRVGSQQR